METAKSLDFAEFNNPSVRERTLELTEDHVIVEMSALHHGMGDKFPLDNCKFYGKYNRDGTFWLRLCTRFVNDRRL